MQENQNNQSPKKEEPVIRAPRRYGRKVKKQPLIQRVLSNWKVIIKPKVFIPLLLIIFFAIASCTLDQNYQKYKELSEKFDTKQSGNDSRFSDIDKRLKALDDRISPLASIDSLEKAKAEQRANIEALLRQIADLSNNVTQLSKVQTTFAIKSDLEGIQTLSSSYVVLQKDFSTLKASLDTVINKINTQSYDDSAVKQRLNIMESYNRDMSSSLQDIKDRLKSLETNSNQYPYNPGYGYNPYKESNLNGESETFYVFSPIWVAQTYTPSTSKILSSISVKLYRADNLDRGLITIGIKLANASGFPTGDWVSSGTIQSIMLPVGNAQLTNTPVNNLILQPGQTYCIVVYAPAALDNTIGVRVANPSYISGTLSSSKETNAQWTTYSGKSLIYELNFR